MREKLPGHDHPTSAASTPPTATPHPRKRKHPSPSPQPTIPQLFAPPPQKRSRSNSTEHPAGTPTPPRHLTPLTEATMLNFPPPATVIDLTTTTTTTTTQQQQQQQRPPPFQPRAGASARKLTVKNLRKPTKTDPSAYFNATWASLDAALTAIFTGGRIEASLEELYRGTENVCRADRAPGLFERLRGRMEAYVKGELRERIEARAGRSVEETVKAVEGAWEEWGRQLGMIRSIFLYLDRSFLLPSSTHHSIETTGLDLFSTHIATSPTLEPRFLRGIFDLFEHDRQGHIQNHPINITLLLSCVRLISSLGLYTRSFEPRFVATSRAYFEALAQRESRAPGGLAAYLRECRRQLKDEAERCERFGLELSTKRNIVAVIEDEMVRKQLHILTDPAAVGALLVDRDFTPLATLYSLLSRVTPAGPAIRPAWETHIATVGTAIVVAADSTDENMVPRLLEFKHALDTMSTIPFRRDDTLSYTLRESFASFINARRPNQQASNNSKPAEQIAKYVDLLLRTGTKGLPGLSATTGSQEMADLVASAGDDDAQLAFQLEQVLDLFRFISGKDVFEAFYKADLARRLLMGRSASADAERMMLSKLKTECGSGFTHNLEGMFKDVDLSREAVAAFKASKKSDSSTIDLFVHVLSASAWPSYPETPIRLPAQIAAILDAFQGYYVGKHAGRKLSWRHALSHCVLRAAFPRGNKELVLSAFQAVILLLFNDSNSSNNAPSQSQSHSFQSLLAATALPPEILSRTLQSLACGRHRVLTKRPKGREVAKTDCFVLNDAFSDPKFRVKVNTIQLKETKEEVKETHERVAQDRQYETQAAVIRVMKARRRITHAELVAATIEATKGRGVLDLAGIKKNIERLIEKEYMERAEDGAYVYLA